MPAVNRSPEMPDDLAPLNNAHAKNEHLRIVAHDNQSEPIPTEGAPLPSTQEPEAIAAAVDESPLAGSGPAQGIRKKGVTPKDPEGGGDVRPNAPTIAGIFEIAKNSGMTFFHDELGRPFAEMTVAKPHPHRETRVISRASKSIVAWLRSKAKRRFKVFLSRATIKDVLELLEHEADTGAMIALGNRMVCDDGKIYIDLVDDAWRVIEVTPTGWRVVIPGRPLFSRNQNQLPLPEPVGGGSVERLFQFIPVGDEQERLLIIAWLLAAMNPAIIKPILMQKGQPGSAKTTRTRFLRSLIDPSRAGVLGELERKDLAQVLFHHAVPCFDNLGRFSRAEADFFCRAVTGVGLERRKLYTDTEQVVLSFRRPIILNGLEVPTNRPDFLDRCLVLNAERLPGFKSELELGQDFERARPELLGAMLDLLVRTLSILPATEPTTEFRMADFVQFGRAVSKAMGREPADFDQAYRDVQRDHLDDAAENDPLARAVVSYLEAEPILEGTAEQILKKLTGSAKLDKIPVNTKEWPRSGRWLSTRINELAPILAAKGIVIKRLP